MSATVELKCSKIQGYSLRAAMEVKAVIKVSMLECECESVNVIRVRSEYAMDSIRVLKFIFYKYMHVGVECKIEQMKDVINVQCKMKRERLMSMHELTSKLKELKERCKYTTRIVHLMEKSCNMHTH